MIQAQLLFILSVSFAVCSGNSNEITTFTTTVKSTSSESGEDANGGGGNRVESGGRTVVGDIEKLKKIGEILQTVGGKIIPVLVGNSLSNPSTPSGSAAVGGAAPLSSDSSEETRNRVRGLQIIHDLKKEVDDITAKNNKT